MDSGLSNGGWLLIRGEDNREANFGKGCLIGLHCVICWVFSCTFSLPTLKHDVSTICMSPLSNLNYCKFVYVL